MALPFGAKEFQGTGMPFIRRAATSLVLALAIAVTPVLGGIAVIQVHEPPPEEDVAALETALRDRIPELAPWTDEAVPACEAPATEPALRALLMGFSYPNAPQHMWLKGTINDLRHMQSIMRARQVADRNVEVLEGSATRTETFARMSSLLSCVGSGDQVMVYFAGNGHPGEAVALSDETIDEACAVVGAAGHWTSTRDCGEWVGDTMSDDDAQELAGLRTALAKTGGTHLLLDFEMDESGSMDASHALRGDDLANFAVAVRSRGASIFFVFDGCDAAGLELGRRQSELLEWRATARPGGLDSIEPRAGTADLGEYAAFYAVGAGEYAIEKRFDIGGASVTHGLFTFHFANSLVAMTAPSVRALADRTVRSLIDGGGELRGWPVFEATRPELPFLRADIPQNDTAIIVSGLENADGGDYRGEGEVVEIHGQISSELKGVERILVDGHNVVPDADGRFVQAINRAGRAAVDFNVLADGEWTRGEILITFDGAIDTVLGQGERYALIIGNENYADPSYTDLRFPHEDAEAVAEMLTGQYGFRTSIDVGGEARSLVLLDATLREMVSAFTDLASALGEDDSLLVYYAGHGTYSEERSLAAWLPANAEKGYDPSLFTSDMLQRYINDIRANRIIVVSDSCYAGRLLDFRADDEIPGPTDAERDVALLKLLDLKTRVFIAAGDNQPVLDGGGFEGRNSIFASGFLAGLSQMEGRFTARELLDKYISPKTSARQVPVHSILDGTGSELAADFVFDRVGPVTTAAVN